MLKKITAPKVLVSKNEILTTTSINIAEVFDKLHKNILRDIEELRAKLIEQSTLFVLFDNNILTSICAVMIKDRETIEIKNLATYPKYQNMGCASALIDFVCNKYKTEFKYLILGTGENDKTLTFYKKRGFQEIHSPKNNYATLSKRNSYC